MGISMIRRSRSSRARFASVLLLASVPVALAAYKAKTWTLRPAEQYPARLASEGVTIALEPLYSDVLAGAVFDKNDLVTRGIMPLGIIIFNDNDFPVEVDGSTAELIVPDARSSADARGEERLRTVPPGEVVKRVFTKDKKSVVLPNPLPRLPGGGNTDRATTDAIDDFDRKLLDRKVVAPHDKGGGFLYLRVPE